MARSLKAKSFAMPRKAVSFAVQRVFPASHVETRGAETSASPRVRDSLVLRLVAKRKTAARKETDERVR